MRTESLHYVYWTPSHASYLKSFYCPLSAKLVLNLSYDTPPPSSSLPSSLFPISSQKNPPPFCGSGVAVGPDTLFAAQSAAVAGLLLPTAYYGISGLPCSRPQNTSDYCAVLKVHFHHQIFATDLLTNSVIK
jgi:hypothetical protein